MPLLHQYRQLKTPGRAALITAGVGKAQLETFTEPKILVENPLYPQQRKNVLTGVSDDMIDGPIIELIHTFNRLPFCFTLQCCHGHFMHAGLKDPYNLRPLPMTDTIDRVEYRIAYICLCIEHNDLGKALLTALKKITVIDPDNIQFCCAEWFWKRQVNSYALQVQPARYRDKDTAVLGYREALHIEKIRNEFFEELAKVLRKQPGRKKSG